MFQNNLLLFVLHEDILLTQRRILAGMATECNSGGPVVIAVYNNEQYEIKKLPKTLDESQSPQGARECNDTFTEADTSISRKQLIATYIDRSISWQELVSLINLIRSTHSVKTLSLCCHANLTNAASNQITFAAHKMIDRLKPNHLMLISSSLDQSFTDSGIYAAGKPSHNNYTLPSMVKTAVVFTRMNLIQKIKQEQQKPTWIKSRTTAYNCTYYFSCFVGRKKAAVSLDALDDDEHGDDNLVSMSEHPDNVSQCNFDDLFYRR